MPFIICLFFLTNRVVATSSFLQYVDDMSLVALITLCTFIDLHIQFPHKFLSFLEGESVPLIFLSLFLSTVTGLYYVLSGIS